MKKLPARFYADDDVVSVSKALLGKVLVTNINNEYTAAMIVETEAYAGVADKASHAFGGRHTNRTKVMYQAGGLAYIYLCYGIHHLFNVVTNLEGTPHAVLIRAAEPLDGIDIMLERRGKEKLTSALTAGPGAMSMALGITTGLTGTSLLSDQLYIEDRGIVIPEQEIMTGTRVGVAYAQEDALRPYRFWVKGNKYVSKGKGL
jgi:DNA-3-methyladenine glycosylase